MKKARATMPRDSRHVRPGDGMLVGVVYVCVCVCVCVCVWEREITDCYDTRGELPCCGTRIEVRFVDSFQK
jgi:hypothetical protein